MDRMASYRLTSDGSVHIRAWRHDDGHWSSSFDEHPEFAFGGDSALVAAKRLVHLWRTWMRVVMHFGFRISRNPHRRLF